jgi:hypothetical protein
MNALALSRHRALHDEIVQSHPSLVRGIVLCSRCGKSRRVDAAQCLRFGWPKCCQRTMTIDSMGPRND